MEIQDLEIRMGYQEALNKLNKFKMWIQIATFLANEQCVQ